MPRNCLRADVGTELPNLAGVGGMPRAVRSNSATPMLSSIWRTAMLAAGCVMPRLSATDGMWCCSVSATNARTRRSWASMPNIAALRTLPLSTRAELAACALHFGMHPPCPHEESPTIFRKEHSPHAAFEQLHAELAFQLHSGASINFFDR